MDAGRPFFANDRFPELWGFPWMSNARFKEIHAFLIADDVLVFETRVDRSLELVRDTNDSQHSVALLRTSWGTVCLS